MCLRIKAGLFDNMSIPFLSQYDESIPESWRSRACSVTNLFMVLKSRGVDTTVEALIGEGESIGAFGPRGWTHEGIVRLAHNHGVSAYAQEFRSRDENIATELRQKGLEKIKQNLPVIASIQKDNGSFHTITLVEATGEDFMVHDPEEKEPTRITEADFLKKWRGLSIFFEK